MIKFLFYFCFSTCIHFYSHSQTPPIELKLFQGSFVGIVDIASSANDSRLFIVDGRQVKIIKDLTTLPVPMIDLSDRAIWIMAIAFHPNYSTNGFVFIKYQATDQSCVVSKFTKSSSDNDKLDPTSEDILFSFPGNTGHQGGDLEFGKDGYLYTTTGDGASGARNTPGDEFGNAQNLTSIKGKMLRFDVNADNYIPIENPYQIIGDGIPDEIIANGLRNPWKFSFDRSTGDLWIGDVGQDSYEEVDFVPYGDFEDKNYGWSCYEGNMLHLTTNCLANTSNFVSPILTIDGYLYNGNLAASVTGGYVYRGRDFPNMAGFYIYADYNSGLFYMAKEENGIAAQNAIKGNLLLNARTFGEDSRGELFVANATTIYQVVSCGFSNDLTLNGQINAPVFYSTKGLLSSEQVISTAIDVTYTAGTQIVLTPGFSVSHNAVFRASINPACL